MTRRSTAGADRPTEGTRERINKRKHRRELAAGPGKLVHRRDQLTCELLNLSYGGACIVCPKGLVPALDEPVQLRFIDGSTVIGRVAWIAQQQVGISFASLVPDIHDRPDAVSEGSGFYTRIVSFQIAKQRE